MKHKPTESKCRSDRMYIWPHLSEKKKKKKVCLTLWRDLTMLAKIINKQIVSAHTHTQAKQHQNDKGARITVNTSLHIGISSHILPPLSPAFHTQGHVRFCPTHLKSKNFFLFIIICSHMSRKSHSFYRSCGYC